ncbi:MAG: hypothetical protein JWN40_6017 [Phycisphaerales bacterium]|nr:hypothetical protein [Phycisphaerales bacterium]
MKRNLAILALLLLALMLPADANPKGKPRQREGNYNVSIGGYLKGDGMATIAGDQLAIQINVMSEDGAKGPLSAPNLTIVGTHFSGSGTFQSQKVSFEGRVDAPDNDVERGIKGVRLSAVVKTADARYSRLVGYIPALAKVVDPPPPNDDDDRSRSK